MEPASIRTPVRSARAARKERAMPMTSRNLSIKIWWGLVLLPALAIFAASPPVSAKTPSEGKTAATHKAQVPVDGWPKQAEANGYTFTIYQPQVDSWQGNELKGRAAVSVEAPSMPVPTYGAVEFTARTEVDKSAGMVTLADFHLIKATFPAAGEKSSQYEAVLKNLASNHHPMRIALERLQADLSVTQAISGEKSQPIENSPPHIIISETPALLVLVDGEPVLRQLVNTDFLRVINTRALILLDKSSGRYFLFTVDRWFETRDIQGSWRPTDFDRSRLDAARKVAEKTGQVSLMSNAEAKKAFGRAIPAIYVSLKPASLVVLKGKPKMQPISNTQLLYVTNTTSDLFLNTADQKYYVRLTGRWFRAPALDGPWDFVAADALPSGFAKIPVTHPRADVLASVAGTPQAKESLIANNIPQTATVDRSKAKLEVKYDGAPHWSAIQGTPLAFAENSPIPVIKVDAGSYYALQNGIWFVSTSPDGAWTAAASVPAVIYTIPPSSPVHYVTYARVYGATPTTAYVGYTPGYMGTVVSPAGVVVFGTGYAYTPWIGTVYYPPPATYGYGADVAYSSWGGWSVGFGLGYPVYPPYWGPYAYGAGFAAGVAVGAAGWGCCWYGGYNVTVNNVYNHWSAGTVTTSKGTYQYAHAGHTSAVKGPGGNAYVDHNGNIYRKQNGQWQHYQNGSWNNVNRQQTARQQASNRTNTTRRDGSTLQSSRMQTQSLDRMQTARQEGENRFKQFRSGGGFSNFRNSGLFNDMQNRFGNGRLGGERQGGGQLAGFRGGGFGGFGGGFEGFRGGGGFRGFRGGSRGFRR